MRVAIFGLVTAVALVGCSPTAHTSPASTQSAVAASPSPSASMSASMSPTDIALIERAFQSGHFNSLAPFIADSIEVAFAPNDLVKANQNPTDAASDLNFITNSHGWKFNVDSATLIRWRSGHYGAKFPPGALVGRSREGFVVSFAIEGDKISAIFVSGNTKILG
jgi:hypothetical protein